MIVVPASHHAPSRSGQPTPAPAPPSAAAEVAMATGMAGLSSVTISGVGVAAGHGLARLLDASSLTSLYNNGSACQLIADFAIRNQGLVMAAGTALSLVGGALAAYHAHRQGGSPVARAMRTAGAIQGAAVSGLLGTVFVAAPVAGLTHPVLAIPVTLATAYLGGRLGEAAMGKAAALLRL